MCRGVIPAFGLQGYVAEHLFSVTTLLIDRSLGNSGLRRIFFLLFAWNPNRAWLIRQILPHNYIEPVATHMHIDTYIKAKQFSDAISEPNKRFHLLVFVMLL
jgi:hypothetical protein